MPLFAQGLFAENLFAERLFSELDEAVPQPEPEVQTPAGRSRRRKYIVEVDGQEFVFDDPNQALALLNKAEKLASVQAERQAAQAESAALPKAIRLGKADPVTLKQPAISGSDSLSDAVTASRERIRKVYEDAALAAELRLLMALQAEQDDEEALLWLM